MKCKHVRIPVLLVLVLALFAPTSWAAANIPVYVNGQSVAFDVPPTIVQNRTLVPMRAIFEALGATVTVERGDPFRLGDLVGRRDATSNRGDHCEGERPGLDAGRAGPDHQ